MGKILLKCPIYLAAVGIILAGTPSEPAVAQQFNSSVVLLDSSTLSGSGPGLSSARAIAPRQSLYVPIFQHGASLPQFVSMATPFSKPLQANNLTTIDRMEAAFYCNDTPFVDQVRFPLASLWGGRLKLVGIESDVTTANFVLGLPGGGTLPSLGMFSSGHLATHTPPSDQLTGVHLTFNLRGSEVNTLDNSGLHGLQYVMRASRGFLQSVTGR